MLDTGCWIYRNAPSAKSGNIQYPACRGEALKERRLETSISPRRRLYEPEARINP
jgi:hypothetical protein